MAITKKAQAARARKAAQTRAGGVQAARAVASKNGTRSAQGNNKNANAILRSGPANAGKIGSGGNRAAGKVPNTAALGGFNGAGFKGGGATAKAGIGGGANRGVGGRQRAGSAAGGVTGKKANKTPQDAGAKRRAYRAQRKAAGKADGG